MGSEQAWGREEAREWPHEALGHRPQVGEDTVCTACRDKVEGWESSPRVSRRTLPGRGE